MTPNIIFDIGRPLIMAHRGDPSSAPENTMLAMEKAVEAGIDVLETDIRMTRDGELVLFHDDTLERITGHNGTIAEYTIDELRAFDLGHKFTKDGKTFPFRNKGLRIVTLDEAFKRFPDIMFNLDIKDLNPEAPVNLSRIIKTHDREESVIVGSFHLKQIQKFREILPEVATAAGPDEVKRFVISTKIRIRRIVGAVNFRAFQVPVKYGRVTIVTPRFVREAHRRNIAVHVWTINNRTEMEQLIRLGIDGIFTDNPRLLRQVMKDLSIL